MNFKWKFAPVLLALVLLLVVQTMSGCIPRVQADQPVPMSGAGDLYYLSVAINDQSDQGTGVQPVKMTVSDNSISDLKQGKTDIALLGREPTAAELNGLTDYVIAYDAICIIIDEHTYVGGISNGQVVRMRR